MVNVLACGGVMKHVDRSYAVADLAETSPDSGRLAAQRDAVFQALADEHLDRAYRLARAILRDPTDACDATHDAFVRAWRSRATLRDASRFEPWFDRILVNVCRNRLRVAC
jgi:DNA-directed RNA polymerase specialized sigma24 family protein